jgi:hypothetical protein
VAADPRSVIVRGLAGSTQVIVSPVPGATDGMKVRVVEPGARKPTPPATPEAAAPAAPAAPAPAPAAGSGGAP